MFIAKKSLCRRTFLRGTGAMLTLPFLDAMIPACSAAADSISPSRLGFFYVPNGIHPESFHPKGDGGTHFEMSEVLQPLESLREHVTIISGLENNVKSGGACHSAANSGWLSGVTSKPTEGADVYCGKTLDQYAADVLGKDTLLRSLELTTESNVSTEL